MDVVLKFRYKKVIKWWPVITAYFTGLIYYCAIAWFSAYNTAGNKYLPASALTINKILFLLGNAMQLILMLTFLIIGWYISWEFAKKYSIKEYMIRFVFLFFFLNIIFYFELPFEFRLRTMLFEVIVGIVGEVFTREFFLTLDNRSDSKRLFGTVSATIAFLLFLVLYVPKVCNDAGKIAAIYYPVSYKLNGQENYDFMGNYEDEYYFGRSGKKSTDADTIVIKKIEGGGEIKMTQRINYKEYNIWKNFFVWDFN